MGRSASAPLLALSPGLVAAGGVPLGGASAQESFVPHRAHVNYDPGIPTPRAVLGHDPADAITSPEEIVRYFQALAQRPAF
jgi:hypothetical protein